jgi:hypothetical protein
VEALTDGLLDAAQRHYPGTTIPAPTFGEVEVGTTVLQRVKVQLPRGTEWREVHLYETYWAPKTEGVVGLKDVIAFLWNGGSRGFINCFAHFQRALFNEMVPFNTHWRTPFYLLGTLLVLAALMVINAIILATAGRFLGLGQAATITPLARVFPLTTIANVVSCIAISFGATLFLAEISRPGATARKVAEYMDLRRSRASSRTTAKPSGGIGKPGRARRLYGFVLTYLTWIALLLTAAAIVAGATSMAYIWRVSVPVCLTLDLQSDLRILSNGMALLALLVLSLGMVGRKPLTANDGLTSRLWKRLCLYLLFCLAILIQWTLIVGVVWLALFHGRLGQPRWLCFLASSAWVWPFLIAFSALVRQLLVQYVGDVTAYISSNKIDRFEEVRQKIKALAKETASAVYSAKAQGTNAFEYGEVAIVGHSLGSVIAYDTLNRVIADDALSGRAANIIGRTSVLLTFGSPLDKIAFFFSIMSKKTRHIREQIAAVVQPLIEDVTCRNKIPWVNVFSRNDVICGSLDFYDFSDELIKDHATSVPPLPHVDKVTNAPDEDALIPLVAHVEYWSNTILWDALLNHLL